MESIAQALPAHDFSFLGLFLQADPIVKGVMLVLIAMSVGCWTIIIDKWLLFAKVRRQAKKFVSASVGGERLADLGGSVAGEIGRAAFVASNDNDPTETRSDRRERIERAMRVRLSIELKRLERGLPFLATTGSSAPFIGLFGTVWGIMNSFSAIARSQDTSLSVVAPGIAEALFATAVGLAAAIPAVMAYNKLTADLSRLSHKFSTSITVLSDRLARGRNSDIHQAAE